MRAGAVLAMLAMVWIIGCSPRPDGFDARTWEVYQMEHPGEAKALEWIARSPARSRARRAMAVLFFGEDNDWSLGMTNDIVAATGTQCLKEGGNFEWVVRKMCEERINSKVTEDSEKKRAAKGIAIMDGKG